MFHLITYHYRIYYQNHHIIFCLNTWKYHHSVYPLYVYSLVHITLISQSLSSIVAAPGASSWHVWLLRTLDFHVFIRFRVPESEVRGWKLRDFLQVTWGCPTNTCVLRGLEILFWYKIIRFALHWVLVEHHRLSLHNWMWCCFFTPSGVWSTHVFSSLANITKLAA